MFLDKKKTAIALFVIAVFLLVVDRFLKMWALNYTEERELIGEILKFKFVKNYYIAFSLPLGGEILIAIISAIIGVLVVYSFVLYKKNNYVQAVLLFGMVLGAGSNLSDRLRYGYVIDYIDLKYFTIFNIADSMIVCSVLALFVIQFIDDKKNILKKSPPE